VVFDGRGNAIWSYHPAVLIAVGYFLGRRIKRRAAGRETQRDTPEMIATFLIGLWAMYLAFLCCLVWTGYFTFGGRYLCDVEPLLLAATLFAYVKLPDHRGLRTAAVITMLVSIEIKIVYICAASGII